MDNSANGSSHTGNPRKTDLFVVVITYIHINLKFQIANLPPLPVFRGKNNFIKNIFTTGH